MRAIPRTRANAAAQRRRTIFHVIASTLFLLLTLLAMRAQAETKLEVHADRVLQADYLGVNQVYHGFAFMPENEARGMSDADRDREFSRVAEMHLNIARTWFRPDWSNGD